MDRNQEIDQIDRHILDVLAAEGRLSITDLAARINLSKTPTQQRLRRLERDGFILGYRAIVNQDKIARNHIAFAEVKLHDTTERALKAFNGAVRSIPEVEECHMMASSFDYLLKVRTRDIADYRRVMGEEISKLPHVAHTSSHVSMESVIDFDRFSKREVTSARLIG